MSATRFRFPLARLLTLRERRERDAAITLASARSREDALQANRDLTLARRADARAALLPAPGEVRGVAEMYGAAFLIEQLDAHAVATAAELRTAAEESTRSHVTLVERVRERRMLERLRDRQLSEWRLASDQREQNEMDTIAQAQHASASPFFESDD